MPSKLLFLQNLIDFDADWNSNHRLLFHSRELTPGSTLDAIGFLADAITFWVRNMGILFTINIDTLIIFLKCKVSVKLALSNRDFCVLLLSNQKFLDGYDHLRLLGFS